MNINTAQGQQTNFTNSVQPGADPTTITWSLAAVAAQPVASWLAIDPSTGDITGTVSAGLADGTYCANVIASNGCAPDSFVELCFIVGTVQFSSTNPPVAHDASGGNASGNGNALNAAQACDNWGGTNVLPAGPSNSAPVDGSTQFAFNDLWNLGSFPALTLGNNAFQCVQISDQNADGSTSFAVDWNFPANPGAPTNGVEVISYPALKTGQVPGWASSNHPNMPIPVSDVHSMYMGYESAAINAGNSVGHMAYDLRLQNTCTEHPDYATAQPDIYLELFVVMEQFNNYGAHPGGRNPAWYRGQYDIGGVDWHFYIQPGATGVDQYIWLPVNFPAPNPVDMAGLMKWAQNTNGADLTQNPIARAPLIEAGKCLVSNSLGFELTGDVGNATITNAYTDVNQ